MSFALCLRRSASSFASVCGRVARAQAVTVIVKRSSLVPKPSLFRPFVVSRGFPYSTATERLKSDQTLLQVIDSEINDSLEADDHDAVISLLYHLIPGLMDENEDDMDDDEDGDGRHEKANYSSIPLVVTVTKMSGLSLEFSCAAFPDEVVIDGLSVNRPENSSEEPYG